MMTKQTQIATFMWQIDNKVAFSHGDEDNPDFHYMDVNAWYDMGKPKTVTITTEPGDLLNG